MRGPPRHGGENCGYTSFDQCWATTGRKAAGAAPIHFRARHTGPATPGQVRSARAAAGSPPVMLHRARSAKPSRWTFGRVPSPAVNPDSKCSNGNRPPAASIAGRGSSVGRARIGVPQTGCFPWVFRLGGHRGRVSQALERIRQAAPEARVPAETTAANHRGRRYNSRCYDNWRRGCDYDWTSIRETSSVRTTMKARTTSARSAGTVNIDE